MNTRGSQAKSFDEIAYASARMDFNEFRLFAQDFCVTPQVMSAAELKQIFHHVNVKPNVCDDIRADLTYQEFEHLCKHIVNIAAKLGLDCQIESISLLQTMIDASARLAKKRALHSKKAEAKKRHQSPGYMAPQDRSRSWQRGLRDTAKTGITARTHRSRESNARRGGPRGLKKDKKLMDANKQVLSSVRQKKASMAASVTHKKAAVNVISTPKEKLSEIVWEEPVMREGEMKANYKQSVIKRRHRLSDEANRAEMKALQHVKALEMAVEHAERKCDMADAARAKEKLQQGKAIAARVSREELRNAELNALGQGESITEQSLLLEGDVSVGIQGQEGQDGVPDQWTPESHVDGDAVIVQLSEESSHTKVEAASDTVWDDGVLEKDASLGKLVIANHVPDKPAKTGGEQLCVEQVDVERLVNEEDDTQVIEGRPNPLCNDNSLPVSEKDAWLDSSFSQSVSSGQSKPLGASKVVKGQDKMESIATMAHESSHKGRRGNRTIPMKPVRSAASTGSKEQTRVKVGGSSKRPNSSGTSGRAPKMPVVSTISDPPSPEVHANWRQYSRFYRDRVTWECIGDVVLWQLARETLLGHHDRSSDKTISAWSCGCSTGEEVYTLQLVWAKRVAPHMPHCTLTVVGTDLSSDNIEGARQARYPPHALVELPPQVINHLTMNIDSQKVLGS